MVGRVHLKLAVKALRSRRPTIHFLKYIKMIYLQKTKDGFLRVIMQNQKNRHLVYKFFDTSQGGYHPQMEPAVNTIIYQGDERPWWRKKINGCLDTWIKGYIVKMEL